MITNINNKETITRARQVREVPQLPPLWREILNLAIKIVVITAIFVLVFNFIYGFHRSADTDMVSMIKSGDLVMFSRLDKNYPKGSIVILKYQDEYQLRRVAAVSADTVNITDDGLVINGATEQESEIYQKTRQYESGTQLPVTLGKDQVFILGDARGNVKDSRKYGPVDTKNILGKVMVILRKQNL